MAEGCHQQLSALCVPQIILLSTHNLQALICIPQSPEMQLWPNPGFPELSLTNGLRARPADLLGEAKTHSISLQEPPARQKGPSLVLPEHSCPQAGPRDGVTQRGKAG